MFSWAAAHPRRLCGSSCFSSLSSGSTPGLWLGFVSGARTPPLERGGGPSQVRSLSPC